eukprot:650939-Prymnesium_polylepis.1
MNAAREKLKHRRFSACTIKSFRTDAVVRESSRRAHARPHAHRCCGGHVHQDGLSAARVCADRSAAQPNVPERSRAHLLRRKGLAPAGDEVRRHAQRHGELGQHGGEHEPVLASDRLHARQDAWRLRGGRHLVCQLLLRVGNGPGDCVS